MAARKVSNRLDSLLATADPGRIAASGLEAGFIADLERGEVWPSRSQLDTIGRALPDSSRAGWDRLLERLRDTVSRLTVRAVLTDLDACLSLADTEELSALVRREFHPGKHLLDGLARTAGIPFDEVLRCCYGKGVLPGSAGEQDVLAMLDSVRPSPLPRCELLLSGVDPGWGLKFVALASHLRDNGEFPASRTVLGGWAVRQRALRRRGALGEAESELLESLTGWRWDPPINLYGDLFADRVRWYVDHVSRCGTSLTGLEEQMPASTIPLRKWLAELRRRRSLGQLSDDVVTQFESLPDWTWDHEEWETDSVVRTLEQLTADGTTLVEAELSLAARRALNRVRGRLALSPTRTLERLDAVPGWVWLRPADDESLRTRYEVALRLQVIDLPREYAEIATRRSLAEEPETLESIGRTRGRSRESVRVHERRFIDHLYSPESVHAFEMSGGYSRIPSRSPLRSFQIQAMREMIAMSTLLAGRVVHQTGTTGASRTAGKPNPSHRSRRGRPDESASTTTDLGVVVAGFHAHPVMHGLPPRVRRVLLQLGVNTRDEFLALDAEQLVRQRSIGVRAVDLVKLAQGALLAAPGDDLVPDDLVTVDLVTADKNSTLHRSSQS